MCLFADVSLVRSELPLGDRPAWACTQVPEWGLSARQAPNGWHQGPLNAGGTASELVLW